MQKTHWFKTRFISLLIIFLISALLSACGPDESSDNNQVDTNTDPDPTITRELSGTAAVGAPVVGTITIVDADGNILTVRSSADGTYTINLADHLGPYLIRIEPDDATLPVMYSYATDAGVTNITPFTSLALFLAYQTDLETAYINWISTLSGWQYSTLEQAIAKINANFQVDLQNAAVDPKKYDFFTTSFDANNTGIDAVLENYSIAIDFENSSYSITNNSTGQTKTFDENIDTTGYYIGAYFIPEDTAQWELTYTYTININGTESTATVTYPFTTNDAPWNRDRFNELFWNNLGNYEKQTYTCPEDPRVQCEYTWEVTRLESTYTVVGNGEVGTVVTGDAGFTWTLTGYTQYIGQPRQDIDYSYSWDFTWQWERVS